MIREISETEFIQKIKDRDGDFTNYIFNFSFNFSDFIDSTCNVDFEINFSYSIFRKSISFSRLFFRKGFIFSKCQADSTVDFYHTNFLKSFILRKTEFHKKVNFNLARFYSDADFNSSIFYRAAHFKKARFRKNLFMGRVIFCEKIDFSYVHFSNDYYTSFTAINKENMPSGKKPGYPFFIFRNIFFPSKTVFNEVNLSRTVFQDSIIDKIIFKDCFFSKKGSRDVFYTEISKKGRVEINYNLEKLKTGHTNTLMLPNTEEIEELDIGDILEVYSNIEQKSTKFFIVTKFAADNHQEMKDMFNSINLNKTYSNFDKIIFKDCFFSKKGSRDVFYTEISKKGRVEINYNLEKLKTGHTNTLMLPNTEEIEELNIGDILEVYSNIEQKSTKFFIVTKFVADNHQEMKDMFNSINLNKTYSNFNKIVCHDCVLDKEEKITSFRLKLFDERKR
jgi:uncharacterized protein YjbI with pentapeptide repeats